MNQFDSFVVKDKELVSSDLLPNYQHPSNTMSNELNSFYLINNPNKEAFHINELLNSSLGTHSHTLFFIV